MCLTNCGSVSNHSLLHSRKREAAVARRFPNVLSLPGSSIKVGADANGPCFPPVMAQKALFMSTSNAGAKPVSWQRFFAEGVNQIITLYFFNYLASGSLRRTERMGRKPCNGGHLSFLRGTPASIQLRLKAHARHTACLLQQECL